MNQTSRILLMVAILPLAFFYVTPAKANCVNPSGSGGCFATIQDAIDTAVAGETVEISPGTYFEVVEIPVGKDGLTLLGMGPTPRIVIDGDAPNSGNVIDVLANGVTFQNLTIKNGTADGINVAFGATGTRIIQVHVLSPELDCLEINGDDTLVERSQFSGCGLGGINAVANNVTILENIISLCGSECIIVSGDNVVIEKNKISVADDDCIEVSGANAVVGNNKVDTCEDSGIAVFGADPSVYHNSVKASGDGPAYNIDCSPCTGGQVTNNVAFQATDGPGFDIFADAPGLVVEGNKAIRAAGDGFSVSGTGIVVRRNKAINNGADSGEHGFAISGTGHTLERNIALRNHDDGFSISGMDHELIGNRARKNLEDGFDLEGADNVTFNKNRATNNNAVGVEVSAGSDGNTVTKNRASRNRTDFCNEGTATVVTGNSFGTTGPCVID